MAEYLGLRTHIDADPDVRGYSGMEDAQVAVSLNTAIKSEDQLSMAGNVVFDFIDETEWDAITADNQLLITSLCSMSSLDPFGLPAHIFLDVFGGGSDTIIALNAARQVDVTDAQFYASDIGLSLPIKEGYVFKARAIVLE